MSEWEVIESAISRFLPHEKVFSDLWAALDEDYGDRSPSPAPLRVPDDEDPLELPRD